MKAKNAAEVVKERVDDEMEMSDDDDDDDAKDEENGGQPPPSKKYDELSILFPFLGWLNGAING